MTNKHHDNTWSMDIARKTEYLENKRVKKCIPDSLLVTSDIFPGNFSLLQTTNVKGWATELLSPNSAN